jgi:hypothetical protein
MPSQTPRITGLLFNCAMNCALPRLLENIDTLAALEQEGNLPEVSDATYAHYERLKTIFMTHYGQHHAAACSWEFFSTFLKKYSFYGQEIMFAPVFRIFISEMALQIQEPYNTHASLFRDIQSGNSGSDNAFFYENDQQQEAEIGHYHNLSIEDLTALFCAPLAIGDVHLYVLNSTTKNYAKNSTMLHPITIPTWLRRHADDHSFSMYLGENHYELLPHTALDEPLAEYNQEVRSLPRGLAKVHEIISQASNSAEQASRGLAYLVIYVHDALEASLRPGKAINKKIDYNTYKNATAEFHGITTGTNAAPETFARILLAVAARTPAFKALAERLLQQDKLSPELIQIILNPNYDLTATFEAIQPSTTNLTRHSVFNVPYQKEFEATYTKMIQVLSELRQADKITQAEYDALRREIESLHRNTETYEQFLQTMQQCKSRLGGKFMAYCMLAAGYAAKICSLGYLGDTWIEQANQTLEHIKTLENFASDAEIFYKPTQ